VHKNEKMERVANQTRVGVKDAKSEIIIVSQE
jgi:hypothetical protein